MEIQCLRHLLAYSHTRIKRRGGILRHKPDAVAPQLIERGAVELQEVFALEKNAAGVNARIFSAVAKHRQSDRRFAATGFTHQTQHLTTLNREADAVQHLCPAAT